MLGELVPRGGGDPIPLRKARLLVGRRARCDIRLSFPNISAQHCELEMREGYWQVRDLGSTNGVKVNGNPVEVQVLMPGDVLAIAQHVFEVVYQPSTDGPPPVIDEQDPFSQSLLEKAGLEQRRRRSKRPKTPPSDEPNNDGDTEVVDWLNEEDLAE